MADIKLRVDPDNSGGSKAQSSWISPAVLVNLPNYRLQDMSIKPTNPPLGATPEKMTFSPASTYKSGFILELGQERKIVVVDKIVDSQQSPLATLALEVRRIDDLNDISISTFTSRSGRFQMPNVKPGRYEIRPLPTTQWGSVIVVIPETNNRVYRLGDITVMRVQSNRNPF